MTAMNDIILEAFHRNTQHLFDQRVLQFLEEPSGYDALAYARNGARHPGYKHTDHFSYLYSVQISHLLACLKSTDQSIVVVDLACCGGSFILSAAKILEAKGLLNRVQFIGMDRTWQDMRFGRQMAQAIPGLQVQWHIDNLEDPTFAARLRGWSADLIVANHILEHLPGDDITNRYIQDWLLACRYSLSISVPLLDNLETSISDHVHEFVVDDNDPDQAPHGAISLHGLAKSMGVRVGNAVEAVDIEITKYAGLCTWVMAPEVLTTGGFSPNVLTLKPGIPHHEQCSS